MGIEKAIKNELDKLRNIKAQIEKTLQNAPEEKLRCAINNGYYQYYIGKEYQGTGKKLLQMNCTDIISLTSMKCQYN